MRSYLDLAAWPQDSHQTRFRALHQFPPVIRTELILEQFFQRLYQDLKREYNVLHCLLYHKALTNHSEDRFPPLPTSLPYDYRVWTMSVKTNLTLVVWQMMLYPTTMQDILLNIINAQNAVFRGAVAHGFNSTIPQDGLEWPFGGCWLQLNNKSPKRLTYVAAADVLFGIKGFMRRFGVWCIAFDIKDDYSGIVGRGYYGP